MPTRTREQIDAQKQQAADLAKNLAASASAGQTAAIQSTPPGYITGFKTVLTPEYKIDIYPGVVNVAGQRVELKEKYTLKPGDETMTRLGKIWWYLYIDKSGKIHGDVIPPEFKSEWMAYYHKNQPWRNFGRYFVCDDHLCYFVANWQQASDQTVYVASSTFQGIANYYCTGTDDQILINAAIRYLHEAYNGGTINLLQGTYNTVSVVGSHAIGAIKYPNIRITGSGKATSIINNGAGNCIGGGVSAGDGNNNIIENVMLTCPYSRGIYAEYCDNLIIRNVYINGFTLYGIYIANATNVTVEGNIVDGNNIDGSSLGIVVYGERLSVGNNIIQNLVGSSGDVRAIEVQATTPGHLVYSNRIYNIISNASLVVAIGIYAFSRYIIITNNTVMGVKNNVTSAAACGIQTGAESNMSIIGNYCYNNGSSTGIANTNLGNFNDNAGTDTQVYSNSWQQPVAGEPSCGTYHPHYKELVTNGTPAAGYYAVDLAAEVPVGAKTVYLEVNHASAGAGRYISLMTDSTPTPTSAFFYVVIAVASLLNSGSGMVHLTSDSKFTYRASNTTLGLYIRMHGYWI